MKRMTGETKRTLCRAAVCGFLLAAVFSMFPFAASCEELPQNVLRLHVIANSDSAEDQRVKLKVRDAVLTEAAKWYGDDSTMEEASSTLCVHLEALQAAADRALLENGSMDRALVQVTEQYFPTRNYETFALPAGKYRTLLVTIGAGAGKNWWCVVFPSLCLPAAGESSEELLTALPESQREVVEHPQRYHIKFKAVELYEELKKWLGC